MGIRVRSEQELNKLQEVNLIPEGVYKFKVKTASDKRSKSGNEMIKLLLELKTPTGRRCVYDYLVDVDRMAFKVKHFCQSTGADATLLVADECLDQEGEVDIVIKSAENGYPAKNAVADYVANKGKGIDTRVRETAPVVHTAEEAPAFDDDIPF